MVRTLKGAVVDLLEGRRRGACTVDATARRFVACEDGSGIMHVGRRNRGNAALLRDAVETCNRGI